MSEELEESAPPPKRKWRWLKRLGLGLGGLALLIGLIGLGAYFWFSRGLPDYKALEAYVPPLGTKVYSADGELIAEFAKERRTFVPYEELPPMLVNAVVAAEDKTFFTHGGIDYPGIIRAVITNWEQRGTGKRPVGASTITQQVAKNLLLTGEVSIDRKVREAILARRIEASFTKERIMELYLNQIFLGQRSYGVAAAALTYFNKSLDELTLPEMAFIAGLPKAPSVYNPSTRYAAAIERRNYVLEQMRLNGFITPAQAQEAKAQPITLNRGVRDLPQQNSYFVEEVRRDLIERFGEEAVYGLGLNVHTSLDPALQAVAEQHFRDGLVRFDRGKRWRGAYANIPMDGDWAERLKGYDAAGGYKDWKTAVVLSVSGGSARVGFTDGKEGVVPPYSYSWAAAGGGLKRGDVVIVRPSGSLFELRQQPEISGGFVAMDPNSGLVKAMVGGWAFTSKKDQFNRATQAMRQPGSAFKPFVYAAALENGFTPSSIVVDGPFSINQGRTLGVWTPKNYSGRFYGPSTLRVGLEYSRNLMTVRLAHTIGMDKVVDVSKRMGIQDKMLPVLAMSLGAGETTVLRLTGAYAMLTANGRKLKPSLIGRVYDRFGKVVYRHDPRVCKRCNAPAWGGQSAPVVPENPEYVISPHTAYQVTHMLEGVIERGTGQVIQGLNHTLAGKTGTTNESTNVWFAGMSPDMVVGLYMGYDTPRPMGSWAQGGTVAAPIFKSFMAEFLKDKPDIPFRLPDGIRLVRVNVKSGKLVTGAADGVSTIYEAFKPGTEPLRASLRVGDQQRVQSFGEDLTLSAGGIY